MNKGFSNLKKENVFIKIKKEKLKPGRKPRSGDLANKRLVITCTIKEKEMIALKRGSVPESIFLYERLKEMGLFS